eukprot:CAMPEP_0204533084 /NCGR_PEP_ID=MMETSP0661-20131031/12080_1 /ASSEMBLY_ACC=CAM_ASM_000606 /TAXON_ID=109239 /ORGANISM="Alexandrium margalefi, Strain AMGDE01CS-322" /LENGTH=175 /DNA_ID=CAMNT_0051539383 /DNA_START=442 /DNA_END=969 /DNA_ORIENTATION=-
MVRTPYAWPVSLLHHCTAVRAYGSTPNASGALAARGPCPMLGALRCSVNPHFGVATDLHASPTTDLMLFTSARSKSSALRPNAKSKCLSAAMPSSDAGVSVRAGFAVPSSGGCTSTSTPGCSNASPYNNDIGSAQWPDRRAAARRAHHRWQAWQALCTAYGRDHILKQYMACAHH